MRNVSQWPRSLKRHPPARKKGCSMTLWMIEPHDSLIFRDSRPFHALPGAKASTLPFPFPSTLAGAARTQAGLNEQGMFWISGDKQLEELKHLAVRGPFLAQLTRDGCCPHPWTRWPLRRRGQTLLSFSRACFRSKDGTRP